MNCLSIDDFRIVKLSQDLGMHPALVSAKVAVWQEENGNTNDFPKAEDLVGKIINIYHSGKTGVDNKSLSNLFERPFTYNEKRYFSVEHAYQSLKSGKFDLITYNKYKGGGVKIGGNLGTKTDNNYNISLMKTLMKESFEQNPSAKEELLNTGNSQLTHTQDNTIWKTKFPELLMEVRNELSKTSTQIVDNNKTGIKKIISGGQTGGDLGGLEGAKSLNIETGGTAPPNFISGNKSEKQLLQSYGLVEGEQDSTTYTKRTMKNVDDSDGTVAILWGTSVGTGKTIGYAQTKKWQYGNNESKSNGYKPVLVIKSKNVDEAAKELRDFVIKNNIQVLNIAGHRETSQPGIQDFTKRVIQKAFEDNDSNQQLRKKTGKQLSLFSADKLIQSKIVDEYFKAKEISDIFQNIQTLQQLIKGFKGTFAESEVFINALNKLGYDINKDFTDIEAHTKPTQQFYKNYNNVTSKVNGIDRVLNDKFLKQSIITAIDLMKVSKSFFVSQTSLAKSIRDNVSSLFKPFKASKTTFKNNFRKNFLSYLTVTAYINSVKNDEDLKIPHIKDFLLTPLDEVAEGKEYNELQSKYFQILSYNRENGIKNDFLDFLQPSKVDHDKHSSSLLYNYRLNLMEMDSRNVKDPDKIQSLISGFNQLYFANNDNIIEKNEEVKRINNLKYEFARDMFKYLIVKDGLLYQNQSFIKAIDPILFLETSHKLDEIQEVFKKENPSSSEFTKLFGMTKEELELDFVLKFSLHANNYFDLKSQKLGVILTEKKDRDVLISKQKEEEKQADFAETDKIENAEYGDEENIDEELVQEDNYPLYWHNVDKSLTVNLFAGQTTNMSTQEKKQNKAENKRYILSKENEIFKKIREPFKTPDGQIKHYDVIGLPVTTYVNDKKGNTANRIPLKLAIVQNTIKIGTSFLTFQFTPEGKAVIVDSRTMTKLRNMGVMFTDLQNNSIFDIINDSAKLKLQTNKENIPNLIKIAKELSNFYRGGYIIGTRAEYEKTIILGSSKLSSFGDDLQSQMDIKMSEEEQKKVTLSMYNRKDKTIKDEDKRDILIAEINKYSTNTITKESAKNIGTPNLEEALKRFIKASSSNLTEKQIEDKIKECFKTK